MEPTDCELSYLGTSNVRLQSGDGRRSAMGRDFGEKLRVERWNGGSRLKVREKEGVERGGDIGVERHWLNQGRLSASGGLLSRGLRS